MPLFRIAIAQVSSESNHFVPSVCELDFLKATGYHYEGAELLQLRGTDGEIGGTLALLEAQPDVQVVPILATRGNSSTVLSEACWGYLREGILSRLRAAGRIDGVLLSHHGSMATVHEDDPEGDMAEAVRALVGPGVPIAMTLDLHGNITDRMVRSCDIIIGYEHYPHDDVATTGKRASDLLLRTLRGQIKPVMAQARLPMMLTGFLGSTFGDGPFAKLMNQAKAIERNPGIPGILSTSMSFVGSYIDIPDISCSSLVITDNKPELAEHSARALAAAFWARRREFVVPTVSVAEAVKRGRAIPGGPVLLLDTADTTGGGASGDSIGLVKGLIEAGVTEACIAMVVDPHAVECCAGAALGEEVALELGHRLDPRWGKPLAVKAKVLAHSQGRFQYKGGVLGGTVASMGASVVLGIGSIRVLVMTRPTYDWAYEQYASVGLDPRQAKFVGVKNMMNFRFAYRDLMKGHFVLDLPGPTPPDMRSLPFKRIKRPMFPFDEMAEPRVEVTRSEQR